MRVLGVDLGLRHLGIAISDPGGALATPLRTIPIRSVREAPGRVAGVVRELGAGAVVVGIPEGLEGEEKRPEAQRARRFARALRRALALPVHLVDESSSTREAERRLAEAGRAGRDSHAAAAAVILQRWLDERPGRGEVEGP